MKVNNYNPVGIEDINFNDCVKRAKSLASNDSYSGGLYFNKDARRVVFLVARLLELEKQGKK